MRPEMSARVRWITVLVGAVLFGSASFFYGLVLFQNGLAGLTMQELAIWLVGVGVTAGAFLGFLVPWVMAATFRRWARFLILGTVSGLLVGVVFGFNVDEACEVGIDQGFCGSPYFGSLVSPWIGVALWTVTGGIVGGVLGLAAGLLTRPRDVTPSVDAGIS